MKRTVNLFQSVCIYAEITFILHFALELHNRTTDQNDVTGVAANKTHVCSFGDKLVQYFGDKVKR